VFPSDRLDLLWARDGSEVERPAPHAIPGEFARQTAFEYLLANFMIRTVEARYRVLSVRSVLLSTYALRHDFALLGTAGGPVMDLVAQVGEWRRRWFRDTVARDEIVKWFAGFLAALRAFLQEQLAHDRVALPRGHRDRYGRHIRVLAGPSLAVRHRGLVLPAALSRFGRRFVRAQHRLNRFEFTVPAVLAPAGSALEQRFELFRELLAERRRCYPQFGTLATPWVNLL
jgi:hypothetical protein